MSNELHFICFFMRQILMPRSKHKHYALYTMNWHHESIDIHDTRRYTGHADYTTKWHRSDFHSYCTEVIYHVFSQLQSFVFLLLHIFLNCTVTTLLVHIGPHFLILQHLWHRTTFLPPPNLGKESDKTK